MTRIHRVANVFVAAIALSVMPAAHAGLAGSSPTQFAVSDNGAATYTIPIQVPPGVNGVEPKLAITYNSQGGNGLLGVGAGLSGLSSISRCAGDIATDGARKGISFSEERFCLDGARLINACTMTGVTCTDYIEYRTQIESFSRIRAYGADGKKPTNAAAPTYFKVWTKSGEIREYGNTSDSKYLSNGTTWLTWGVNKIGDRQGNYIDVTYASSGGFRPATMRYGGPKEAGVDTGAVREVVFGDDTAAREDKIEKYVAGVKSEVTQRLKTITTKYQPKGAAAEIVRVYTLKYESEGTGSKRSRLTSVQECDANNNCYTNPVEFSWKAAGTLAFNDKSIGPALAAGSEWGKYNQLVDVDGDGISDLVQADPNAATTVKVFLGNGDGTFSANAKNTASVLTAPTGTDESVKGINQWNEFADMNGDGFVDIFQVSDPATGTIKVHLGKGTGTFTPGSYAPAGTMTNTSGTSFRFANQLNDMNGDGLMDLVRVSSANATSFETLYAQISGTSFSFKTASFPTGATFASYGTGGGFRQRNQLVDFNGDGLPDVYSVVPSDTNADGLADTTKVRIMVAIGSSGGTVSYVEVSSASPMAMPFWTSASFGMYFNFTSQLVDVNADGALDVVAAVPSGSVVRGSAADIYKISKTCTYTDLSTNPPSAKTYICRIYEIAPVLHSYDGSMAIQLGKGDGSVSEPQPSGSLLSVEGLNAPAGSAITFSSEQKTTFGTYFGAQNSFSSNTSFGVSQTECVYKNGVTTTDANGRSSTIFSIDCFADANVTGSIKGISHANQFADIDGDGFVDVVRMTSTGALEVSYGKGDGTFSASFVSMGASAARDGSKGFRASNELADLNGDGVVDIFTASGTTGTSKVSTLGKQGLVDAFKDGNGLVHHPEYRPLTDESVYWKTSGKDAYPVRKLTVPMYAVQTAFQTDAYNSTAADKYAGNSFLYETRYRYKDLRLNHLRGWSGFAEVAKVNLETGPASATEYTKYNLTTHTRYRQDFPYTGRPEKLVLTHYELTDSSGNPLDAENVYRKLNVIDTVWNSSERNGVHTVFEEARYEYNFEPNDTGGGNYPDVGGKTTQFNDGADADTSRYDEYGNPDIVDVYSYKIGQNSHYVSTNYGYTYAAGSDFLGQLSGLTIETTHTIPDQTKRTRKVTKTYYTSNDAATGMADGYVATETTEPADALERVVTYTYTNDGRIKGVATKGWDGTYDANGNPSAGAKETRTVEYSYANLTARQWQTTQKVAVGSNTLQNSTVVDGYWGVPKTVTDVTGIFTTKSYDELGRLTSEQGFSGTQNASTITYASSCAGTGVSCFAATKLVATMMPPTGAGAAVVKQYDALNRELRVSSKNYDAANVIVDTEYDGAGRVGRVSNPYLSTGTAQWTTFAYDNASRLVRKALPNGAVIATVPNGLETTTTRTTGDEPKQTTVTTLDAQGNVVSVLDANNRTTTYEYEPFNTLGIVTLGSTTLRRSYDVYGNLISQTDPDMGTWQYRYNAFGELVWQKDAKGQTTSFEYDDLGRMTKRTESTGAVATMWTFDNATKGLGLLDNVSRSSVVTAYTYDANKRPRGVASTFGGVTYTTTTNYVATTGQVASIVYPSGGPTINYAYYGNGAVKSVTDNATSTEIWSATELDERNQPTKEKWGSLIESTRTYNPTTSLLEKIRTGTGDNIQSVDYDYYNSGNLRLRRNVTQNLIERFTYDSLNRLVGVSPSTGASVKYDYDHLGNVTYKSDVGGYNYGEAGSNGGPHAVSSVSFANVPSYTTTQLTNTINDVVGKATTGVDCQAQIGFPGTPTEAIDLLDVLCISKRMADASAGGVTYNYTYDANGNMLTGAGRTLTYTAFNKPNTITANGATTTFTYDADYQRVKKSVNVAGAVTNYFTIGDLYEKIVKPTGGTEYRYTIHAAGRVVAQVSKVGTTFTTQYVHTDLLGSIDALTEKNGTSYTIVESKSFSEFGAARLNTWAKGNPPFAETTLGYTGHEMDVESGLIDMNARLYDPVIGRFVTADSVISNVYDPQNLNRYSYVLNNPFGYTDPTGHVANPMPGGGVYVDEWDLYVPGNGSGMAYQSGTGDVFGSVSSAFGTGSLPSTANDVGLGLGGPSKFSPDMIFSADLAFSQFELDREQLTHTPWSSNVNSDHLWMGAAAGALPVAVVAGAACAASGPCAALAGASLTMMEVGSIPASDVPFVPPVASSGKALFPVTADDIIMSASRPSRPGSETSRGIQALQKKLSDAEKSTHFVGLPLTQKTVEQIIYEAYTVANPVFKTGTGRGGAPHIEVYNPDTGRGIRLIQETGAFDTFVNIK